MCAAHRSTPFLRTARLLFRLDFVAGHSQRGQTSRIMQMPTEAMGSDIQIDKAGANLFGKNNTKTQIAESNATMCKYNISGEVGTKSKVLDTCGVIEMPAVHLKRCVVCVTQTHTHQRCLSVVANKFGMNTICNFALDTSLMVESL